MDKITKMDSELIVQANHPIAHITTLVFNRPQRGNSLSPSMISLLISALDDCNQRSLLFLRLQTNGHRFSPRLVQVAVTPVWPQLS